MLEFRELVEGPIGSDMLQGGYKSFSLQKSPRSNRNNSSSSSSSRSSSRRSSSRRRSSRRRRCSQKCTWTLEPLGGRGEKGRGSWRNRNPPARKKKMKKARKVRGGRFIKPTSPLHPSTKGQSRWIGYNTLSIVSGLSEIMRKESRLASALWVTRDISLKD